MEFGFSSKSESSWETEGLEWMTMDEARTEMKKNPHTFHRGVILLFKNSGKLIQHIRRIGHRTAKTER